MIRNEDILDQIYDGASLEYQRRVPTTTQASLEESMQAMLSYGPAWNEFQHSLINRIGSELIRQTVWANPLAPFKNPDIMFGSTIEEIKVGLIKARTYSADRDVMEKELLGQEPLRVDTAFHTINREDKYKMTLNTMVLRRAFLNQGGLSKLLNEMMLAPSNSDNWDEFQIMTNLFNLYEKNDGFHKVNIPDVRNLDSDGADARLSLRKARAVAGEMQFLSTKFNAAGMPTAAKQDELYLFATPDYTAAIDVEALAGAFNMSKMDMAGRTIPIPKDSLKIKGAQAIITTKDFFVCNDTLVENQSFQNAGGLYTNFFFHHHGIYSASRFAPAVLLTSEPVTETITIREPATAVTIDAIYNSNEETVTTLNRGENFQVDWAVAPDDATDRTVLWSLDGNKDSHTRIDQNGIVHIWSGETATAVTIKATLDTVDTTGAAITVTDTETRTLAGDILPTWGKPQA